jgi:hypothetical protein
MKRAVIGTMLGLFSCPASAAIDFTDTPGSFNVYQINALEALGQSFTAAGTKIVSVGFAFDPINSWAATEPLKIDLLDGEGLSGAMLATQTVDLGAGEGIIDIDFGFPGLTLVSGNRYTLALSIIGSSPYQGIRVHEYEGDVYGGGRLYSQASFLPSTCQAGGCDLAFRVTMADDVASLPEPASWAMMILGFGLVGSALRTSGNRRKVAAAV